MCHSYGCIPYRGQVLRWSIRSGFAFGFTWLVAAEPPDSVDCRGLYSLIFIKVAAIPRDYKLPDLNARQYYQQGIMQVGEIMKEKQKLQYWIISNLQVRELSAQEKLDRIERFKRAKSCKEKRA